MTLSPQAEEEYQHLKHDPYYFYEKFFTVPDEEFDGKDWAVIVCWYCMMGEGRKVLVEDKVLTRCRELLVRLTNRNLYGFFIEGADMNSIQFNNGSEIRRPL